MFNWFEKNRELAIRELCMLFGGGKTLIFLSLLVFWCPLDTRAQYAIVGAKNTIHFGGVWLQRYQLGLYDAASGSMQFLLAADYNQNWDAASFDANGNLVFSGRTTISLAGNSFHPSDLGHYSWTSSQSQDYLVGLPGDVAAVHIIDSNQMLLAFKVPTSIGGLTYEVGDIVLYNRSSDTAALFFSHQNFFSIEEGGTYPVGNIDAVSMTAAGDLLLSTTNTAEIGQTSQNAVRIRQSGVYQYDMSTGEVTVYIDPDTVNGLGADIKAFAQLQGDPPNSDSDTIVDFFDLCPLTPFGEEVNWQGCALVELDSDNDGVNDAIDLCPDSPLGESVDSDGCANSQFDDDNDGVINGKDRCPDTPEGISVNSVGCESIEVPLNQGFVAMLFAALVMVFSFSRKEMLNENDR